jgi:putative phosphoesterase
MNVACPAAARVAILSDTHGHLDPRIAKLVEGCDCVVHAGDIGGAGVLAQLRPLTNTVVAVLGNNDVEAKWAGEEHAVLHALPVEARLELEGGTLVVLHGHGSGPVGQRHARLRRRFSDARAVVYGHSHRLVCDQVELPWVVNPGVAGRSRTYGGPSCMVLSIAAEGWSIESVRFSPLVRIAGRRRDAAQTF